MISVEATDYEDVLEEAISNNYEELMQEFVKNRFAPITIEYGENRPYSYHGSDDAIFEPHGEITVSIDDVINEVGIEDFFDWIYLEIKELKDKLKECNGK